MGTLPLGTLWAFVLTPWMVAMGIVVALLSLTLPFVTVAAARRAGPTVDPADGTLVFRYPPLLLWGSICLVVGVPVGFTAFLVAHPPRDIDDTFLVILAYALLTAPCVALVWEVLRFRLVVGPDGLDCRSPWRRRRFVRWLDVAHVSFDSPLGHFKIHAADGHVVRLPVLAGGLGSFLGACERRLTPSQLVPALRAYSFLDRPFPDE